MQQLRKKEQRERSGGRQAVGEQKEMLHQKLGGCPPPPPPHPPLAGRKNGEEFQLENEGLGEPLSGRLPACCIGTGCSVVLSGFGHNVGLGA